MVVPQSKTVRFGRKDSGAKISFDMLFPRLVTWKRVLRRLTTWKRVLRRVGWTATGFETGRADPCCEAMAGSAEPYCRGNSNLLLAAAAGSRGCLLEGIAASCWRELLPL